MTDDRRAKGNGQWAMGNGQKAKAKGEGERGDTFALKVLSLSPAIR